MAQQTFQLRCGTYHSVLEASRKTVLRGDILFDKMSVMMGGQQLLDPDTFIEMTADDRDSLDFLELLEDLEFLEQCHEVAQKLDQ